MAAREGVESRKIEEKREAYWVLDVLSQASGGNGYSKEKRQEK